MTKRYFVFHREGVGWIVWDRHKNEAVASYPNSPQGKAGAEVSCDEHNYNADARAAQELEVKLEKLRTKR